MSTGIEPNKRKTANRCRPVGTGEPPRQGKETGCQQARQCGVQDHKTHRCVVARSEAGGAHVPDHPAKWAIAVNMALTELRNHQPADASVQVGGRRAWDTNRIDVLHHAGRIIPDQLACARQATKPSDTTRNRTAHCCRGERAKRIRMASLHSLGRASAETTGAAPARYYVAPQSAVNADRPHRRQRRGRIRLSGAVPPVRFVVADPDPRLDLRSVVSIYLLTQRKGRS